MLDSWKSVLFLLLLLLGHGCAPNDGYDGVDGGAGGEEDTGAELAIELSGVAAYEAFKGEMIVEVAVSGEPDLVELLAGEEVVASATKAPFELVWSTGVGDDGIVTLKARASDGGDDAFSSEVPVVIVNGGDLSDLFEGDEGALSIAMDFEPNPEDPGEGLDVVHHWMNDGASSRVIAVVTWDEDKESGWDVELAVGTGSCPHGGTTFGEVEMTGGGVGIDVAPDTSFVAAEQHFSHIRVVNPTDHLGDTLEFEMRVYLFD